MATRGSEFHWKGRQVRVTARGVPSSLWLTASIEVYINDVLVLETGGKFAMSGGKKALFDGADGRHEADLSWSVPMSGGRGIQPLEFTLAIDGEPAGSGTVLYDYSWSMIGMSAAASLMVLAWFLYKLNTTWPDMVARANEAVQ